MATTSTTADDIIVASSSSTTINTTTGPVIVIIEATRAILPNATLSEGVVYVTVQDDIIVAISNVKPDITRAQYVHTPLLAPGFCDIHTHGLGGADDVIAFWTNPEHTQRLLPRYGTTSFIASTVCACGGAAATVTAQAYDALKAQCGKLGFGAVLEGIHSEGPIVADFGALPPSHQHMSTAEFTDLVSLLSPHLKIMTIAPSLEQEISCSRLQVLLDHGVLPSLGHDRVATNEAIIACLQQHENWRQKQEKTRIYPQTLHVTHLFNVCSFNHRLPSLINFGLMDEFPNLPEYSGLTPPTVEVVADMVHVHPMTLKLLFRSRRFQDIVCVTDNMLAPVPGLSSKYCGREVEVNTHGTAVYLKGTSTLAGSCASLLDAVRNLVSIVGVPLPQAIATVTENPARIARLDHIGAIAVGKRADFVFLRADLTLTGTMVAGCMQYQA